MPSTSKSSTGIQPKVRLSVYITKLCRYKVLRMLCRRLFRHTLNAGFMRPLTVAGGGLLLLQRLLFTWSCSVRCGEFIFNQSALTMLAMLLSTKTTDARVCCLFPSWTSSRLYIRALAGLQRYWPLDSLVQVKNIVYDMGSQPTHNLKYKLNYGPLTF